MGGLCRGGQQPIVGNVYNIKKGGRIMSYIKINENDLVAWDYPYKGCLFDKSRQAYAECNKKDVEGYLLLTGNISKFLSTLNWKQIEEIEDNLNN